ncbi:MAG TPA: ferredoxin [Solirubrobacteraceae bacterium]|nr:ferredoxin [Solirubrobacteraceae bacterium]
MKLQISTACQGHGRCYTLAPQLLESDDEGYVTISGGDPIEVPEELRELAEDVVGSCPENAISLIED